MDEALYGLGWKSSAPASYAPEDLTEADIQLLANATSTLRSLQRVAVGVSRAAQAVQARFVAAIRSREALRRAQTPRCVIDVGPLRSLRRPALAAALSAPSAAFRSTTPRWSLRAAELVGELSSPNGPNLMAGSHGERAVAA